MISQPKLSHEALRVVSLTLAMLNSVDESICSKLKKSKSALLQLKALCKNSSSES